RAAKARWAARSSVRNRHSPIARPKIQTPGIAPRNSIRIDSRYRIVGLLARGGRPILREGETTQEGEAPAELRVRLGRSLAPPIGTTLATARPGAVVAYSAPPPGSSGPRYEPPNPWLSSVSAVPSWGPPCGSVASTRRPRAARADPTPPRATIPRHT